MTVESVSTAVVAVESFLGPATGSYFSRSQVEHLHSGLSAERVGMCAGLSLPLCGQDVLTTARQVEA